MDLSNAKLGETYSIGFDAGGVVAFLGIANFKLPACVIGISADKSTTCIGWKSTAVSHSLAHDISRILTSPHLVSCIWLPNVQVYSRAMWIASTTEAKLLNYVSITHQPPSIPNWVDTKLDANPKFAPTSILTHGHSCVKCQEFFPYAEFDPSQKFVCSGCKLWQQVS